MMINQMTQLLKVIPFFLIFLITFSVQGQPPPPGYDAVGSDTESAVLKGNSNDFPTFKGPYNSESNDDQKDKALDKIYKTFLSIKENLRLSKSEKAKVDANDLVTLVTENTPSNIEYLALFDQIKRNAKLICTTNNLKKQVYYFSIVSENMNLLLGI